MNIPPPPPINALATALSKFITIYIWRLDKSANAIAGSMTQIVGNERNFLYVGKCRTVNYQNSYYTRAAKVCNILPSNIRDTTKSLTSFKTLLRKHYKDLTDSIFNPGDPRTLKSVGVKCHTSL